MSRAEWVEFDHLAEERFRKPRNLFRATIAHAMSVAWWFVSVDCTLPELLRLPREVLWNKRLVLLPRTWDWLERFLHHLRRYGVDRLPNLPALCTSRMSPVFNKPAWPGVAGRTNVLRRIQTISDNVGGGRISYDVLKSLRSQYTQDARVPATAKVLSYRRRPA